LAIVVMKKPKVQRPKHKRRSQTQLPRQLQKRISWAPLRKVFAGLGVAATFLGAAAAAVTFLPKMTMSASGLFDESNAYSETFTLANTGIITLSDLELTIEICSIETEKHDFFVTGTIDDKGRCGVPRLRLGDPRWGKHTVGPDETFAITLSDGMTVATEKYRREHPTVITSWKTLSNLQAADIVVVVNYRPWMLPWTLQKPFGFVAEMQPNGKVMWKPRPMDR
jgi:hypothetical protein